MKMIDASKVYEMAQNGAKVFIGRNSTGQPKVKIIRGPFGLFVSRFEIDEQQCEILKNQLNQLRH